VPFNVQNIGGNLYVTYAPSGHTAQTGATEGQGAVAEFDTAGNFLRQVVVGSKLASPWGITMAPASFGKFGGDLLVGNFAENFSEINAFDPNTGKFLGTLSDESGNPIRNSGLWYIGFGNGTQGGDPNTLYFSAGIDGEADGLFGSIQALPSLSDKLPVLPNLPEGVKQPISTVPANGDQNPYGVAFVPKGFPTGGTLNAGDILVSNFNNKAGQQGTGSTILRYTSTGGTSVFFQGASGLGLTGALGLLKSGFVIVGSVPTTDGTSATVQSGSLLILDSSGNVVLKLTDSALLDSPWGLAINDQGNQAQVFVSNVLSGTVTRIDLGIPKGGTPFVEAETLIASGYAHHTDPSALLVGPAGLAFDTAKDILYVASTADNAIYAIPKAAVTGFRQGKGQLVVQDNAHLHGPIAVALAPNGDLLVSNGDAVNQDPNQLNELEEFTTSGRFAGQFQLDTGAAGAAFGIAVSNVDGELRFAAVDDNTNTLDVWTFDSQSKPSKSTGSSSGGGIHAKAVDQLLAFLEEELTSILTGILGHKKNHNNPWSI